MLPKPFSANEKGGKEGLQNLQEKSVAPQPSFQARTFDPAYLFLAHHKRLPGRWNRGRQTDNLVLDWFSW
jgi:hypothetical protein